MFNMYGQKPASFSYVADSTSESGTALGITGVSDNFAAVGSNGTSWYIGKQVPAGKMRVYVKAKGSTSISGWYFSVGANGSLGSLCSTGGTLSLTTAWNIYSCDVDATGLTGQSFDVLLGPGGSGKTAYVAWVAVRPWNVDFPTSSLQIAGGTPITANHGTGTSVQHSDGTGTSGACFFASDGSCTATAGALQNGVTATTQAANDNSTKVATTAYVANAIPKNTLGCLDGFNHLPCVVYAQSNVSESTPTGSYATVWTTPSAGVYRVTGYLYGTTASSSAYQVAEYAQAVNTGSSAHGNLIAAGQIGTGISSGTSAPAVFNLASGVAIQVESATTSGTNSGGVWSRAVIIERLQ
jgi:hypothetical protein